MTATQDQYGARTVKDEHGNEHRIERNGRHCTCHGYPVTILERKAS